LQRRNLVNVKDLSSDRSMRVGLRVYLNGGGADAIVDLGVRDDEINAAVGGTAGQARRRVSLPFQGRYRALDVAQGFGHLPHLHVPITCAYHGGRAQRGKVCCFLDDRPVPRGHRYSVMEVGRSNEQVAARQADECDDQAARDALRSDFIRRLCNPNRGAREDGDSARKPPRWERLGCAPDCLPTAGRQPSVGFCQLFDSKPMLLHRHDLDLWPELHQS